MMEVKTQEEVKWMKREKSCGAIVFRKEKGQIRLLLLKHRYGGHWSFPKGHVEAGETEVQTALREIKEETGLSVTLLEGFRKSVEYYPKPHVKKQVVYFLGEAPDEKVHKQEEEISEIIWTDMDRGLQMVTFRNDKLLITEARRFLQRKEKALS